MNEMSLVNVVGPDISVGDENLNNFSEDNGPTFEVVCKDVDAGDENGVVLVDSSFREV